MSQKNEDEKRQDIKWTIPEKFTVKWFIYNELTRGGLRLQFEGGGVTEGSERIETNLPGVENLEFPTILFAYFHSQTLKTNLKESSITFTEFV